MNDNTGEFVDELADVDGPANIAVAVTVAMHVASVALLHRSALQLEDRVPARRAAEIIALRLRRRGDAPLGRAFGRALAGLGTAKFEAILRAAASRAAQRVHAAPRSQLQDLIGSEYAVEVLEGGHEACLVAGSLRAADVEALAAHLDDGAEFAVGIGHGRVFAPEVIEPNSKVIEVDVDHLPSPRRRTTLAPLQIRQRGFDEAEGAVNFVFRTHAGEAELRIARVGRHVGSLSILDGAVSRLCVDIRANHLELTPMLQDEGPAAMRAAATDWISIHQELQRDPMLADLVGDLFTRGGFGGSAVVLRGIVKLAPLIHRHEAVARHVVATVPASIRDPIAEVLTPLAAALHAAENHPTQ